MSVPCLADADGQRRGRSAARVQAGTVDDTGETLSCGPGHRAGGVVFSKLSRPGWLSGRPGAGGTAHVAAEGRGSDAGPPFPRPLLCPPSVSADVLSFPKCARRWHAHCFIGESFPRKTLPPVGRDMERANATLPRPKWGAPPARAPRVPSQGRPRGHFGTSV